MINYRSTQVDGLTSGASGASGGPQPLRLQPLCLPSINVLDAQFEASRIDEGLHHAYNEDEMATARARDGAVLQALTSHEVVATRWGHDSPLPP